MTDPTVKIREIAKKLLSEGKVEAVIGYRRGTVPLRNAPYFARHHEEADNLIWDSNCRINLANFLPRRKEKVAVIAKACDTRNIVNHIAENQIDREQVYIVGVPCDGMIDPEKVRAKEPREIIESAEEDGVIILKGKDFTTKIDKTEVLRQNCGVCAHRNPPVYDELAREEVPEIGADRYADLKELLAQTDSERYEYFSNLVKKLHPLLCLPGRLPVMLLPCLFRGRSHAAVGRQIPGSVRCDDLSSTAGVPLRGTMYRLRRV